MTQTTYPVFTYETTPTTCEWHFGEWWGPSLIATEQADGTFTVVLSPHYDMDLRAVAEGRTFLEWDAIVAEWMAAVGTASTTEEAVPLATAWVNTL